MERSEQLNELSKALSEAQGEFTAIPKGDFNPFFKSRYAGLPTVIETASPILTKHGLSVSQHLGFVDGADVLTTYLMHTSGQFIADTMRLHLAKPDAQSHGSATTYARRYAYMSVLGLVADEDDDGAKASQRPQQAAKAKPSEPTVDLTNMIDKQLSQVERAYLKSHWIYPFKASAVPKSKQEEIGTLILSCIGTGTAALPEDERAFVNAATDAIEQPPS